MIKMIINLTEYFERTVRKYPNRTAIIDGEHFLNFAQLYDSTLVLAQIISECVNEECNKLIAVLLPKSTNSIKANLAISYSGNFYMNLDVKSPQARLHGILEVNKPFLIVSNDESIEKLSIMDLGIPILNIDRLSTTVNIVEEKLKNNIKKLIDTDPLCVINTSGSTGLPKGVILNHRSFIDFIEWSIETLEISENEIVGSLSPLVFDIYSFELCMLMSRGSTIVLIPENQSAFPVNILKLLQEQAVSFIFWVPTIMVNIANMDLLSKIQ